MRVADENTRAVDLVREAFEKAREFQEYNVFISLDEAKALKRAEYIDQQIAKGENPGKLAGVPYAVKDNFLRRGDKVTVGSKMLEDFSSPVTSTAVTKLEAEGAILIGRTNMDAFAHGGSTENSYFGPTLNSRDKKRVAGGSSGGSAVAVALGIVPFALGTDTGGSIRQPAAYNGVLGVKPTYGAVSRYGVVAMSSSIDTVGCMTNDADVADLVMGIMAGRDVQDATTLDDFWQEEPVNGKMRVGVIKDLISDESVKKCADDFAEKMRQAGHEVEEIEMPTMKYGLAIYYVVGAAELASGMDRFDSVRYGRRTDDVKDLNDLYVRSRNEGLMMENKRRILLGNYVVSSGMYEKYYLKAQKARTLLMREFDEALEKFDVLLCPTTSNVAFEFGQKTDDPVRMYLEDLALAGPSMAGLPAVSIPAGETAEGLTVGMQLIGGRQSDRTLLRLAKEMI